MQFCNGTPTQFEFGTFKCATTASISCVDDFQLDRLWYISQINSKMADNSSEVKMDTCPSPENSDSRKRPRDSEIENGATKRSNYGAGKDAQYHLKILIPSVVAGAIIGKEGKTIAQLQKETGARVKMSKNNDYYPGTTERVCIISGCVESIMAVVVFIMETIRDKPEIGASKLGLESERDKQLKILVPNSTAGMIIGKGGAYIKQIKEETGAYVQLSQKAKEGTLQERCITISGDFEADKLALELILAKIVEDPQSSSCLNLSYAEMNGPVANFNPTGSPYANLSPSSSNLVGAAAGLNLSLNLNTPGSGLNAAVTAQLAEQIKSMLRATGYSEHATSQIAAAMTTLARYGILGLGLGLGSTPAGPAGSFYSVAPMDATPAHAVGGVFGPIGTTPSSRNSLDFGKCFDAFRPTSISPSVSINNNSFGLGQIETSKEVEKREMEISESIVGAILGPGGRSLVEIQKQSGASIQISKKGTYAPGTQNRVVKIQGTPSAVASAKFFIDSRIAEEEAKRQRGIVSVSNLRFANFDSNFLNMDLSASSDSSAANYPIVASNRDVGILREKVLVHVLYGNDSTEEADEPIKLL